MKVTAFGAKEYDFKDEKGKTRQGITVHYWCEPTSQSWYGREYGRFGFEKGTELFDKTLALHYPVDLEIQYNRYGKVVLMEEV